MGFERWVWSDFSFGGSAFWWVCYLWCTSSTRLALGQVARFFQLAHSQSWSGCLGPRCFSWCRGVIVGWDVPGRCVASGFAWDPQLPRCGLEVYGIPGAGSFATWGWARFVGSLGSVRHGLTDDHFARGFNFVKLPSHCCHSGRLLPPIAPSIVPHSATLSTLPRPHVVTLHCFVLRPRPFDLVLDPENYIPIK